MLIRSVQDDVFKTDAKHIAFAINTEGLNDSGFAGYISENYWKELENCGEHKLGDVLSKTVGDKTFHALVCHSISIGWCENQMEVIKECFDKIPSNGEEIATIAIGTGMIGRMLRANFKDILYGMSASNQNIIIYSNLELDNVIKIINKQQNKKILKK